jgi:hypothetical protein
MNRATLLTLFCLVAAFASAPSGAEEFLLYTPKPAAVERAPSSPEQGVLVRKVTVKPGDTLKTLSRKNIGMADWFPQVLLFNTIKNPDLIQPGQKLLVPVSARHTAAGKKPVQTKVPQVAKASPTRHRHSAEPSGSRKRHLSLDERERYQYAKRAYLNGQYHDALDLFSGFLRRFSQSKFAADASLYRADCFLRLSGE